MPPSWPFAELLIDGTWTDLTAARDVLARRGMGITRGQADESARVSRSSCSLDLRNTAGKYSPRNPMSPYFGKLGRNTPIRIGKDRVGDSFDGRTVVDGWGTTSDGQASWSFATVSGTIAQLDVAGGVGTITPTAGGRRTAYFGSYAHCEIVAKLSTSSLTGDPEFGLAGHVQSNGDCWIAALSAFSTDRFGLYKMSGGGATSWGSSYTIPGGIVAGTWYWVRMQVSGQLARARVWVDGDDEPDVWHVTQYDDDTAYSLVPPVPKFGGVGATVVNGNSTVISVDDFQVTEWRGHFEVPSWPPEWDVSGRDLWVPLTATGILSRLEQQGGAFKSPVYREVTSAVNDPYLVAYWSGEDESGAKSVASALGGQPMTHTITLPTFGSTTVIPGSASLMTMANGALIGQVPSYTPTGSISWRGLFEVPASIGAAALIADVQQTNGGTVRTWRLSCDTGGQLRLRAISTDGTTVLADSGNIGFDIRGLAQMIAFEVVQDGADVDFHIFTRHIADDGTVVEGGFDSTFTTLTVGMARSNIIAANGLLSGWLAGHFMVGNSASLAGTLQDAIVGYRGETAVDRMTRLCAEESIPFIAYGEAEFSKVCGPQRSGDALVPLLMDAVKVDAGILFEPRIDFGLAYRTRHSMHNQSIVATYGYRRGELAEPFRPKDDDLPVANDITASRVNGSSFRVVQTTGPLNVQDPRTDPQAAGRFEKPLVVNCDTDEDLPAIAGWALHKGTWDEARYPEININQARLLMDGKTALAAAAAAIEIGDQFDIEDLPAWLPPDTVEVLVMGQSETYDEFGCKFAFNGWPAGPYRIFVLDEPTLSRLETGGSKMGAQAASGATSLLVKTTGETLWRTGADDFNIRCSGSVKHVTAIDSSVIDLFDRTVSNGWGTPDDSYMGVAYDVEGTASEYSVVGPGTGRMQLVATNVIHFASLDTGSTDHTIYAGAILSVLPTGNPFSIGVAARHAPGGNYYHVQILIATTGVVTAQLFKRVNGSGASISSALTLPVTHAAGNEWRMAIDVRGDKIRGKAWRWNRQEPDWQLFATGVDGELETGTGCAALARRETGNTNGSTAVDWPDLTVVNPQVFTVDAAAVNGADKILPTEDSVTTDRIAALAL